MSTVSASTAWDPDGPGPQPPRLVIAGFFNTFGGADTGSVLSYDGTSWTPIGDTTKVVHSIVNWDGTLVIGSYDYVALWNGASWVQSPPIPGAVRALHVHNGDLYAGTDSRPTIFKWSGTDWQAVGGGDFFGTVKAMTTHNGSLIVAGNGLRPFGTLASVSCMRYDGTSWINMPGGHATIDMLKVDNGELLAGGNAGGVPQGASRWDGAAWVPFGQSLPIPVSSIIRHNGDLLAAGTNYPSTPFTHRVYRWSGAQWDPMYAPTNLESFATAPTHLMSFNGELFSGGAPFTGQGDVQGYGYVSLLRWEDNTFRPFFDGPNYSIEGLVPYNNGVVAYGSFTTIQRKPFRRIAFFDGVDWHSMGGGVGYHSTNSYPTIVSATAFNNDLYATGALYTAGGINITRRIAAWNGSNWRDIPGGPKPPTSNDIIINGLIPFEGNLIAYGSFTTIGTNTPANYIAKYDGVTWTAFPVSPARPVTGAIVFNNQLYIIETTQLARWTGSAWEQLGRGDCCGSPKRLAIYNGELIVAGTSNLPGGGTPQYIARWDGAAWHSFGTALSSLPTIGALGVYNDELYIGGKFTSVGSLTNIGGIARWNGTTWSRVDSGLSGNGYFDGTNLFGHPTCFLPFQGNLLISGHFKNAGPHHSPFLARWITTPCCSSADFNNDSDFGTDADIEAFFACLAGNCCPTCWHLGADFNADGDTGTDADIESFFRVLAGGSC